MKEHNSLSPRRRSSRHKQLRLPRVLLLKHRHERDKVRQHSRFLFAVEGIVTVVVGRVEDHERQVVHAGADVARSSRCFASWAVVEVCLEIDMGQMSVRLRWGD